MVKTSQGRKGRPISSDKPLRRNAKKSGMETLLILDFGSQYTQLIARRVREQKVFSKILPYNVSFEKIVAENP